MRRSPAVLAGGLIVLVVATLLTVEGCRPTHPDRLDTRWEFEPDRPSSAAATRVQVTLRAPSGDAVTGARLRLEAQMAHPGMPTIAVPMAERSPGVYDASVTFTMQGDWVLVATGDAPDGTRIRQDVTVAGVGTDQPRDR